MPTALRYSNRIRFLLLAYIVAIKSIIRVYKMACSIYEVRSKPMIRRRNTCQELTGDDNCFPLASRLTHATAGDRPIDGRRRRRLRPTPRPRQVRDKAACARLGDQVEASRSPVHSTPLLNRETSAHRQTDRPGRGTRTHRSRISVAEAGNVLIQASPSFPAYCYWFARAPAHIPIRLTRPGPHSTASALPGFYPPC